MRSTHSRERFIRLEVVGISRARARRSFAVSALVRTRPPGYSLTFSKSSALPPLCSSSLTLAMWLISRFQSTCLRMRAKWPSASRRARNSRKSRYGIVLSSSRKVGFFWLARRHDLIRFVEMLLHGPGGGLRVAGDHRLQQPFVIVEPVRGDFRGDPRAPRRLQIQIADGAVHERQQLIVTGAGQWQGT